MSVAVEHDKRRIEILENALDVFIDEGYADTTFQKIADRCGMTRTILYIYFKNKREIFTFSIKRFTEKLEAELRTVVADDKEPSYVRLAALARLVAARCSEEAKLLSVIVNYLEHTRKSGADAFERVRRRTIRVRHLVAGLVIAGQKRGELADVPVACVSDMFFGIAEAAIFRVAVLGRTDTRDLAGVAAQFIEGIRKHGD